ncbi:MAG: peptide chain release factor 1 [Planctomycetota bacterium]
MTTANDKNFMTSPIDGRLRDRLTEMARRFDEIEARLADPDAHKDGARLQDLMRERGGMSALVELYRQYERSEKHRLEGEEMATSSDAELRALASAELDDLREKQAAAARALREHILDQEVVGADKAIVEIRAGTGGDEAALFAADVFRMYSLYAELRRWKLEILSENSTALRGYKEIVFALRGPGAYARLRFESGGHRVQRVPETETQGRIHTSAITVAVMEEVEVEEVDIKTADIRVDIFCASGPGGQKVNKTSSAVRLTHIPTGTVVAIQDESSQHKNKAKAMRVLASRIREKEHAERRAKEDAMRRSLIGTGDRSDRIRTYNFPQNRVTDHRIGVTIYQLDRFMLGAIDELLDKLETHDREERLQML